MRVGYWKSRPTDLNHFQRNGPRAREVSSDGISTLDKRQNSLLFPNKMSVEYFAIEVPAGLSRVKLVDFESSRIAYNTIECFVYQKIPIRQHYVGKRD